MKVYVEIQDATGEIIEQQSYDAAVEGVIPSAVIATVETILEEVDTLLSGAGWRCRTNKESQ